MKNNSDITICIVTFLQRSEMVKGLIDNIRKYVSDDIDIVLAVNGNNEEHMPESYRQDMLDLCKKYVNIYPIFCPEFKSLCKLWNTLVIFSKTEYNFIICDDVTFDNNQILTKVKEYINQTKSEFFTINGGFSHFVLTKNILHDLGYFDERLLGFGEEDGDIVHRHIEKYGFKMPNITINGINNKAAYGLRNNKIETHVDNKPRFNREFVYLKYTYSPDGIYGMSPKPVVKVMKDYNQYPYENFVKMNKHNLAKFEKIIFEDEK